MTEPDLLPLSGIRVVALEQAVAAPFCSRQLADLGADVVKIERPDGGDLARDYDGVLNGLSAHFAWMNRGKRSVVLDLKKPDDHARAAALIAVADVLVHNLAPGAMQRLGFGYDDLCVRHPRLIWCGISGYGPDGPYRDRKAYDMLVQAESGVVAVTGSPEAPAKVGISIADVASGLYAYAAILAALRQRDRTGQGERIDISMLECLTEWMAPSFYVWQGTGAAPARAGVRHNMIVPYGAYACDDGFVMLAVQTDREWQRFCAGVLDEPQLANDPRFVTNADRLAHRHALEALIEARFRDRSRSAVLAALEGAGIPTASLNDVPTAAQHPQLTARGRWTTVDSPAGRIAALLPPHNLAHAAPRMGDVPALGQHTAQVLAEWGVEGGGRYSMTTARGARSMLFVPATRWSMVVKAAASDADAVCLDLEDSVLPHEKAEARAAAVRALGELDFGAKTKLVRMNALDTAWAYRDVVDVVEAAGERLDLVMIPKVGSPNDIVFVDMLLSQIARARPDAAPHRIGLEAQIETAAGFVWLREIASASPRLEALIFGPGDYSASMHMPAAAVGTADEHDALYPGHRFHAVMHAIVAAARANGLRCIDGPYAAYQDSPGFERSCRIARALGFDGKQCIHPGQIAAVNALFAPTAAELAHARRVVAAYDAAGSDGRGAASLDGVMIDEASARMARMLLAKERR